MKNNNIIAKRLNKQNKFIRKANLNVDWTLFNDNQILTLFHLFKKGYDITHAANYNFYPDQMEQICLGERDGVDVTVFADPVYSAEQMEIIRRGLFSGIDVSDILDPMIDPDTMYEILKNK